MKKYIFSVFLMVLVVWSFPAISLADNVIKLKAANYLPPTHKMSGPYPVVL